MVSALVALWMVLATALGATVSLSVETSVMDVGQSQRLLVAVSGGRPTSAPALPPVDGLELRFVGPEARTGVYLLKYELKAIAAGDYTLGPVEVPLASGVLQSTTVDLVVRAAAAPPSEPLAAEADFDVSSAWEGQVVVYRYALRSRVEIDRTRWKQLPIDGLVRPRDGGPVRRRYVVDHPDGAYLVDVTLDPVIVTGGQDLELPPAIVIVEVPDGRSRDPLGLIPSTKTQMIATESSRLPVQPLPPAPANFTGLVGDFTFAGAVDVTELDVGESAVWKIEAVGDGTLEGFALPEAADSEVVRMYDGSPVMAGGMEAEAYHAEGDYSRVIVPLQEGTLRVPDLEIVTFSPSKGEYVTHRLVGPVLEVAPGRHGTATEVESFAPDPASSEPLVEEGQEVHDAYATGRDHVPGLLPWLQAGAWLGAMLGLYPGLLALRDWARRRAEVKAAVVAARPLTPVERLARLPSESEARLAVLDSALSQALARRSGPTSLPDPLADEVEQVVETLRRVRFAGTPPPADLEPRVRALVASLEAA